MVYHLIYTYLYIIIIIYYLILIYNNIITHVTIIILILLYIYVSYCITLYNYIIMHFICIYTTIQIYIISIIICTTRTFKIYFVKEVYIYIYTFNILIDLFHYTFNFYQQYIFFNLSTVTLVPMRQLNESFHVTWNMIFKIVCKYWALILDVPTERLIKQAEKLCIVTTDCLANSRVVSEDSAIHCDPYYSTYVYRCREHSRHFSCLDQSSWAVR